MSMVIEATQMTNSDFLHEVYGPFEEGTYGWVCNFRADPSNPPPGAWDGRNYGHKAGQAALIDRATDDNVYFCTSVLVASDQGVKRRKENFYRLACLVLDDVQYDAISQFSWLIETSPGKFQCGILLDVLDPDVMNAPLLDKLMNALSMRGGFNDKSGNGLVRYVRLPRGCNTKPRPAGVWEVKLHAWDPKVRWSLDDACAAFGIDLDNLKSMPDTTSKTTRSEFSSAAGEMLQAITHPDPNERAYHDNIVRLAATLVASGMFPGAAVDFIYSVMDQNKPAGLEQIARWEARRAEVPRAVKSAEKFAPAERQQAVTVNLNLPRDEAGDVDASGLLINLQELQARAGTIKWQVKHMIPDDSLGMFFGASGTYKSFIALDHCLHVAHGLQWMGRKTKPGNVVYVAAEGGSGIYRRVQAWHQAHKMSLTPNFHVCITPMVLSLSEHIEALASAIEQLAVKPALIYIDTLSQTFEGDENSATDISSYLRLINAVIRARFVCTVIVIHHSGHSATERPRGSSALTANVDFMVGIYKPENAAMMARLDVIKQKDGDKLIFQGFALEREVLGQDEDGEDITSLVASYSDTAGKLMASASVKLKAHEQLMASILNESGGQILETDLRHEFYNRLGQEALKRGDETKPEALRQTYGRARKALIEKSFATFYADGRVVLGVTNEI